MATAQTASGVLTGPAIRMKEGDPQAAAALYDAMNTKVYGFFLARTKLNREAAEDLSQEIFVRLIEKIHSFNETKGGFTVWFWRIARNMLIDHYRTKTASPLLMYGEEHSDPAFLAPPVNFDSRLQYSTMMISLSKMETNERELFEMRYIKGLPYKEIGVVTSRSESSLRIASLRLRRKLKQGRINATGLTNQELWSI